MPIQLPTRLHSYGKMFSGDTLSIKKLTLLGFTLVALPLVIALLYSATQINKLSKQASSAIFNVAEITESNRELSEALTRMERYASQYIVLEDKELILQYLELEEKIPDILNIYLKENSDAQLIELSKEFFGKISSSYQLISPGEMAELSLKRIQDQFKQLADINQRINLRSNELINLQASEIKTSAEKASLITLNSLIIIPFTIFIAGLFIVLITKPLKLLTLKIQTLEQGNFENKIELKGSAEIREIADALEVMRTRLRALELQKSSFIRHISHELKTPLAAIREGTELLYDNSVGQLNNDQQEISKIIRTSVTRLQCLIEDLLEFNIVLDSTSLQDSESFALAPLLAKVIDERKLDIKRKKLTIETKLDEINIHCNGKQLQVIFDNLLSNAIKYSPNNGTIKINGSLRKGQMTLLISDQGPGIEAKFHDRIFDAFFQGPGPDSNKIKGSGLGLTIVKELLMRLNGSINIKTPKEKHTGTFIEIILPRAFKTGGNR